MVVEDHERLAAVVAAGLRGEGMAADVVFDGQEALAQAALARYDVIVLDRDLPGLHGDQVCQALAAERCPSRVLMLTAASTIADRVEGLGLGADDYLPKPFDFAELVARIRALARRAAVPLPPAGPPCRSPPRNSPCWSACSPRRARWSPPRNSWSGCGTLTRMPSPPRSRPPWGGCGPSWATRRSSRPSATAATGSDWP